MNTNQFQQTFQETQHHSPERAGGCFFMLSVAFLLTAIVMIFLHLWLYTLLFGFAFLLVYVYSQGRHASFVLSRKGEPYPPKHSFASCLVRIALLIGSVGGIILGITRFPVVFWIGVSTGALFLVLSAYDVGRGKSSFLVGGGPVEVEIRGGNFDISMMLPDQPGSVQFPLLTDEIARAPIPFRDEE